MARVPSSVSPARRGHPLAPVLRPASVAVVGASRDPTKRGHQVVRALVERGYQGRILPVNPRGGELLGLPVWESLDALAHPVDLAVVCTPAETTPEMVARAGRAGVAGAVVLAVGFGERGGEGARLQGELREAARSGGVRLVGPNTSGLLNLSVGLDLVGVPDVPRGRLALLAQSGNVTLGLLREAAARGGEGFSLCVGVGNEADIAFHEYLEFLAGDPHTRAILLYAEGFARGREFLETARRVVRRKPVVLLKGGRSAVGSEAARSHTGAVTTGHAVVRAALRQAGVVEVRRSDELLAVGEAVVRQPRARRGGGVAVLSDGGGQGTLTADALSELDIPVARLHPETQARLGDLLGTGSGVTNPVDLAGAGDRDPGVFSRAMEALLADPGVGGVLVVGLFGGYGIRFSATLAGAEEGAAGDLVRAARSARVPLVVHSMYADADTPALRTLREGEVPVVASLETACRAVGAAFQRNGLRLPRGGTGNAPPGGGDEGAPALSLGSGRRAIQRARREGRTLLLETETRRLLASYGVPQAPARLCRTREEVERAVRSTGGPVALKVLSGSVTHKTEAGGVALQVQDPREGGRMGERMLASVRRWAERRGMEPDLRGVLVSPMLPPPVAELLVGVRQDPSFGPVLTVGAGGTGVELLADLAVRVLPVDRSQVLAMLDELRMGPVLRGYRGRTGVDRKALADLVLALARFAMDHPEVEEVEVNPVFAYRDRAVAVDARALLKVPGEAGRTRRRRHG